MVIKKTPKLWESVYDLLVMTPIGLPLIALAATLIIFSLPIFLILFVPAALLYMVYLISTVIEGKDKKICIEMFVIPFVIYKDMSEFIIKKIRGKNEKQ